MIRTKTMKNDHQENGLLRGPLILMVPASNLVAVMSLDWLDETDRAAVSAKTHGRKYLATLPRTPKDFGEPAGESLCHFPLNMMRIIRVLREDQDEHSASLKTLHDSFGPIGSRFDISGSDPTVD